MAGERLRDGDVPLLDYADSEPGSLGTAPRTESSPPTTLPLYVTKRSTDTGFGGQELTRSFELDTDYQQASRDEQVPLSWAAFDFLDIMSSEVIELQCALEFARLKKLRRRTKEHIAEEWTFPGKSSLLRDFERVCWGSRVADAPRFGGRSHDPGASLTSPQMFVATIMTLGQDAVSYLHQLTLYMKCEDWTTAQSNQPENHLATCLRHMKREPAGNLLIQFRPWKDSELGSLPRTRLLSTHTPRAADPTSNSLSNQDNLAWHPWGPTEPPAQSQYKAYRSYAASAAKSQYRVHWTTLVGLIAPEDILDQIYIVRALAETGPESGVYNTVMGRAIQTHAWESIWRHFCFNAVLDGLQLVLFTWLAASGHNDTQPGWNASVLTLCLAARKLALRCLFEPIMTLRVYGFWCGMFKLLRGWHLFQLLCNILTNTVMILVCQVPLAILLNFDHSGQALPNQPCNTTLTSTGCFVAAWPNLMAFSIVFKWLDIFSLLLCLRWLGLGLVVTPVLNAASHRESLLFLVAVLVIVCACWNAYWSFPIEETIDAQRFLGFIPTFSLMRVFRVVMLGDFDLYELEGVDDTVRGNFSLETGEVNAVVDEGDFNHLIHYGLQLFFIVSVLMGLVLMNIYIALLGNLYDSGKAHRHQLHQVLKADSTYTLLLYKHFCPWPRCFYPRPVSTEGLQTQNGDESPAPSEVQGCWIVFDWASFMDLETHDDRMQQFQDKIEDRQKSMRQRMHTLEATTVEMKEKMLAIESTLDNILAKLPQPPRAGPSGTQFHPGAPHP